MRRDAGRQVDLRRRLYNEVLIGAVAAVDLKRARVRVHYGAGAPGESALEAQTDWIPWLATRAGADRTWWAPTIGEQVVVLAPSGDLAAAVALPGIFQVAAPPPDDEETRAVIAFSDGAVISYDVEAHVLKAELPAGGKLKVVGDVDASGDVEDVTGTMQEMRDAYNGHTHAVVNNATTAPNPKM